MSVHSTLRDRDLWGCEGGIHVPILQIVSLEYSMNNSRDLNELIGMLEGREVPCQPDQTIALFLHDHTLNYVFQNVTKRFPRPISVPITTSWDSTPNAETFMTPDNVLIHTIFFGPDIVSDMSANVPTDMGPRGPPVRGAEARNGHGLQSEPVMDTMVECVREPAVR